MLAATPHLTGGLHLFGQALFLPGRSTQSRTDTAGPWSFAMWADLSVSRLSSAGLKCAAV
jgi:hypothetical protein